MSLLKQSIYALVPQPQTPLRLWEPGYRERYYQQKFGVEYTDQEFKKKYGIPLIIVGAVLIKHIFAESQSNMLRA